MNKLAFELPAVPNLPVLGQSNAFPIRRIFCVGRNYVAHAAEMGSEVDREAPWYFTKSSWSAVGSGSTLPYPPGTNDFQHEIELVVAVGADGFRVDRGEIDDLIFGYGVGLDMTRRDLQAVSKQHRRPWCTGKDCEGGAVFGALTPYSEWHPDGQRISLLVDGETRQSASLADMVWSVPEIIEDLSKLYHLAPGDLIMTGTPAGVGPVLPGNHMLGSVEGLAEVELTLSEPE